MASQITITLTPEAEQFIHAKVESGAYPSEKAYVEELVQNDVWAEHMNKQALNDAIMEGIADAEAGRGMPLEEAFRILREKYNLPAAE